MRQGATSAEITMSDLVGMGADAHRLVRVGAWSFTVWETTSDGEPRMRDVDVGERLGFGRPRKVRELVRRTWSGEKFRQIYVRPMVGRTSMPRGGTRKVSVDEFWLTEAQILKLCARAETPIADAILDDMIQVYSAASARPSAWPTRIAPGSVSLASCASMARTRASMASGPGPARTNRWTRGCPACCDEDRAGGHREAILSPSPPRTPRRTAPSLRARVSAQISVARPAAAPRGQVARAIQATSPCSFSVRATASAAAAHWSVSSTSSSFAPLNIIAKNRASTGSSCPLA